jgi:hypothetical protein
MVLPQADGTYKVYLEAGYSGLPVGYRIYNLDQNFSNPSDGVLVNSDFPMSNGKMVEIVPEPGSVALMMLAGGYLLIGRQRVRSLGNNDRMNARSA